MSSAPTGSGAAKNAHGRMLPGVRFASADEAANSAQYGRELLFRKALRQPACAGSQASTVGCWMRCAQSPSRGRSASTRRGTQTDRSRHTREWPRRARPEGLPRARPRSVRAWASRTQGAASRVCLWTVPAASLHLQPGLPLPLAPVFGCSRKRGKLSGVHVPGEHERMSETSLSLSLLSLQH